MLFKFVGRLVGLLGDRQVKKLSSHIPLGCHEFLVGCLLTISKVSDLRAHVHFQTL